MEGGVPKRPMIHKLPVIGGCNNEGRDGGRGPQKANDSQASCDWWV